MSLSLTPNVEGSATRQFFARRSVRVGVVMLVALIGISIARSSNQGVDTPSVSYGAGQSAGDQWAAVYGAMTGISASKGFRHAQCLNLASLADANGYGWQTGQVAAGQVNQADYMAGCESAIATRLGPPN
jgi:hypothetical protein